MFKVFAIVAVVVLLLLKLNCVGFIRRTIYWSNV